MHTRWSPARRPCRRVLLHARSTARPLCAGIFGVCIASGWPLGDASTQGPELSKFKGVGQVNSVTGLVAIRWHGGGCGWQQHAFLNQVCRDHNVVACFCPASVHCFGAEVDDPGDIYCDDEASQRGRPGEFPDTSEAEECRELEGTEAR